MKVAVLGLPASGKTTVFNLLTGMTQPTGQFVATEAAVTGVAAVKDPRLEFLRKIQNPEKCTPAALEFVDTAGLLADERIKGESRLLADIRECDGILKVVRAFKSQAVPHPEGSVNPQRDLELIDTKLLLADLEIAERRIEKLEVSARKPTPQQEQEKRELALLKRCRDVVNAGGQIRDVHLHPEEERVLRGFCFLTQKPAVVVLNIGEDALKEMTAVRSEAPVLALCAKLEVELAQLAEEERGDFMKDLGLDRLHRDAVVRLCYEALGLITFYTVVGKELRAWSLRKGATAVEAAGRIHSDMAKGFVKAEVVHFPDLESLGSMKEVRAHGKFHLEGKDYVVSDGDIITFKFTS